MRFIFVVASFVFITQVASAKTYFIKVDSVKGKFLVHGHKPEDLRVNIYCYSSWEGPMETQNFEYPLKEVNITSIDAQTHEVEIETFKVRKRFNSWLNLRSCAFGLRHKMTQYHGYHDRVAILGGGFHGVNVEHNMSLFAHPAKAAKMIEENLNGLAFGMATDELPYWCAVKPLDNVQEVKRICHKP